MIDIKIEGLKEVLGELAAYPAKVDRALPRALNRAIDAARTVETREVSRDLGLKSRVVRDALPVRHATPGHPEATVSASRKRIPLIEFNAKGPRPSLGKGRGVSYRIGANGRSQAPNAFLARIRGREGVFARVGRARVPTRELRGPSIGHVFQKFRALAEARAMEVFEQRFDHELGFAKGAMDGGDE